MARSGIGVLRIEIRQANHLRDLLPPAVGVRVADLDDVAARIVDVHLALAARELEDRRAVGSAREHAGSRGPAIDGPEVVDLEREVPRARLRLPGTR